MYMEPMMSSASLLLLFFLLVCVAVIITLRDSSHRETAGRMSPLARVTRSRANAVGRDLPRRSRPAG